jgi:hypothetical protein
MDGVALVIPLQHQDTRPFGVLWIIFNHYSIPNASKNIPDQYVIFSQLTVSMV